MKTVLVKKIPKDLGIHGNFTSFEIEIFPPALVIRDVEVELEEKNALSLPEGSRFRAKRVSLRFLPLQAFAGEIKIKQFGISDGELQVKLSTLAGLDSPKKKKAKPFRLEELIQFKTEGIKLENISVSLEVEEPKLSANFLAKQIQVETEKDESSVKLGASALLEKLVIQWSGRTSELEQIDTALQVSNEGVLIERFLMTRTGLQGELKGKLENSELDAALQFRTQVEDLTDFLDIKTKATGSLNLSGRLKGNIEKLKNTFAFNGKLQGKDLNVEGFEFDEFEFEGEVTPREVNSRKLTLSSFRREREGGFKPGRGGEIEVAPTHIQLEGGIREFKTSIKFKDVHPHWIGVPVLDDLYPLSFWVNGSADIHFLKGLKKDWSVKADLDWLCREFQYDNQRLGKTRQLNKILKFPSLKILGGLHASHAGVKMDKVKVSIGKTDLDVSGKVDSAGYDLHANGNVDLKEIGELSQRTIRGVGPARIHVHGPSTRSFIDFHLDLKDASYLDLNLGNIKGLIQLDERPANLLFKDVTAQINSTPYSVAGNINLGANESISLDVNIPKGEVSDLNVLFAKQTEALWWYPRSLSGEISGSAQIRGGLDLREMVIAGQFAGKDWKYLSERMRNTTFFGGYDRGVYYIRNLDLQKGDGKIKGMIEYNQYTEAMQWDIKSESLKLTDFDHALRLDVPVRGELSLVSSGSGKMGTIEAESVFEAKDVAIRGKKIPSSKLKLNSAGGTLRAQGRTEDQQAVMNSLYSFSPGKESFFRLELNQLDFSPALFLLQPKLIQDPDAVGKVSGMIDLYFQSGKAELSSGKLTMSQFQLSKTGKEFKLESPVLIAVDEGTFSLKRAAIVSDQGAAYLTLKGNKGELEGQIGGEIDLSIVEFLTQAVSDARGEAKLDYGISGPLKEPLIAGRAVIDGATVRLSSLETPFENISGTFQLKQNLITVQEMKSDLGGGRVVLNGLVRLFASEVPELNLLGNLSGTKLPIYPFQYVKVHGKLNVTGSTLPYQVTGQVAVESALSRENVITGRRKSGLKSVKYTPPPSSERAGDFPLFKMDIDVRADRNVWVQNDLFDAELKGNLKIINTLEAPRLLGKAELVQGKMFFKDRVFQLQSGSATFDNPTTVDPRFDLSSFTQINNIKVQLYASGKVSEPKVEVSSNPVMSESEILTLLTLGITSTEARSLADRDKGDLEKSGAASLVLHSLDFNRDVKDKTGLQIQLDESVNKQQGTSVFRPRTETDASGASPKIVVKRELGKRVDVSVGSTVGSGTTNQREVNAEVKVTPVFSVIGVWDSIEGLNEQENRTSYGLDFKLQKRFK